MVTQVLSFSRSGLSDFVVQRVSAVILAVYACVMIGFFMGDVTYERLTSFFWSAPMQVFSTLTLIATIAHAWIGMWTVGTDYLRPAHLGGMATSLRFIYLVGCILIMFVYLVWALRLIWQF